MVFDRGRVIAKGTADELKDTIGGDVVEFTVTDRALQQSAIDAVQGLGESELSVDDEGNVAVHAGRNGSDVLVQVVRALDSAGISAHGMGVRRPSLDEVFLALTGHRAEAEQQPDARTEPARAGR